MKLGVNLDLKWLNCAKKKFEDQILSTRIHGNM